MLLTLIFWNIIIIIFFQGIIDRIIDWKGNFKFNSEIKVTIMILKLQKSNNFFVTLNSFEVNKNIINHKF